MSLVMIVTGVALFLCELFLTFVSAGIAGGLTALSKIPACNILVRKLVSIPYLRHLGSHVGIR